jgi:hypothetical protein
MLRTTQAIHSSSAISLAAARSTIAVSSSTEQVSTNPFAFKNTANTASPIRLLPSRNA